MRKIDIEQKRGKFEYTTDILAIFIRTRMRQSDGGQKILAV
jgi:hypothetical protein